MENTVDVTIPVDAEAARVLADPARREAAGRYLSGLFRAGHLREALAEAIGDAKREAGANGLTDGLLEAELEAWRAQRA